MALSNFRAHNVGLHDMNMDLLHPEDIKAAIRKRFGSVRNFVSINNLPETGVSDIFRGRTSGPVRETIENFLRDESRMLDNRGASHNLHGQNEEAA